MLPTQFLGPQDSLSELGYSDICVHESVLGILHAVTKEREECEHKVSLPCPGPGNRHNSLTTVQSVAFSPSSIIDRRSLIANIFNLGSFDLVWFSGALLSERWWRRCGKRVSRSNPERRKKKMQAKKSDGTLTSPHPQMVGLCVLVVD